MSLPAELTSFVGRGDELSRLAERIRTTRVLTLTGPGGVGKTRLAIRLVRQVAGDFTAGACFVELATLADPSTVPNAAATALGITERSRTPLATTLAAALHDQQLLLVLDNCEHVLEGCADLAMLVARACPSVTLLATSREPLRISPEVTWPVPPLSLEPARTANGTTSEAVELFVERARAVNPQFDPAGASRDAILQVCRKLDGLPLAIELAAARTRSIPVGGVLSALRSTNAGLPLLADGPRDAPPRHQTLRATIAWSYDLLSANEQVLFRRLAPFRGFGLQAVDAVCAPSAGAPGERSLALPDLNLDPRAAMASLVSKSLLRVEAAEQGQPWYVMLDTVREFALERLESSLEAPAAWRRHAWFYLGMAEQTQAPPAALRQDEFISRLDREHGNFRVALGWCQTHGYAEACLRLAAALTWFWGVRGHISEGRRRLETLLDRFPLGSTQPSRVRAHASALDALGRLAAMQGDLNAAVGFEQHSVALFESLGDTNGLCEALYGLAYVVGERGDLAAARGHLQRCLDLLRSLPLADDDEYTRLRIANLLGTMGQLDHDHGDEDAAIVEFEESMRVLGVGHLRTLAWPLFLAQADVLREKGEFARAREVAESALQLVERDPDRRALGLILTELGSICTAESDFGRAYAYLARSLQLNADMGEQSGIAFVFDRCSILAAAQGRHRVAVRLSGAAAALREKAGIQAPRRVQERIDAQMAGSYHALGRLADQVLASGRRLTLAEAIAETYAVNPSLTSGSGNPLSAREQQVATLVGRGLTNRQIAGDLIVSESTIATHVGNILAKLELQSRAQIAVWAAQNVLLDGVSDDGGSSHAIVSRLSRGS